MSEISTPTAPQGLFLSFYRLLYVQGCEFPCSSMICDARISYQGTGTLRSDDDTCYKGEFTADMQLRGKVAIVLSPSIKFIVVKRSSALQYCIYLLAWEEPLDGNETR